MANAAMSYSPKSMKNLNVSLRVLDFLGSNVTGLDTRAYGAQERQIFYQETEYQRYGPIVEIGVSYLFNTKSSSAKKRKTIGDSEF